jgi:Spy/CpxP family protein refolding chaperone
MHAPLRILVFAGTLTAVSTCLPTASAATPGERTPPPGGERRKQARERLEANLERLNLTPGQKEELAPLLRAEREKLAALRDDQSLSPRERLQRLQAARAEVAPEVKAILTPGQYAQWEKMREETRGEMQERSRQRQR